MNNLLNVLQRYSDSGKSTLGLMLTGLEGDTNKATLSGYTLEPPHQDGPKVEGNTRIPAGDYELAFHEVESPKTLEYRQKYSWFTFHIEVKNVPNFEDVYVHIGNKVADTKACVLLASTTDDNLQIDGYIGGSTDEFERWYKTHYDHFAKGGKAFLRVRDETYLFSSWTTGAPV